MINVEKVSPTDISNIEMGKSTAEGRAPSEVRLKDVKSQSMEEPCEIKVLTPTIQHRVRRATMTKEKKAGGWIGRSMQPPLERFAIEGLEPDALGRGFPMETRKDGVCTMA